MKLNEIIPQATREIVSHQKPTHSNNGNELKVILSEPKISACDDQTLKDALKFVMLLVGIRANTINAMDKVEKLMLTSFIRRHYSGHTISEIKYAFDLAIAGKLEIKEVNCFENFTCEYFGIIMTAYRKWAQHHFDEKELYKPEVKQLDYKPTPAEIENGNRELIELRYQRFLNGDTEISFLPEFGVQQLATDGFTDTEIWQDFTKEAIRYKRVELSSERELLLMTGKGEHAKDLAEQIAKLSPSDETIISIAKKLALRFCFSVLQKKRIENIYKQE